MKTYRSASLERYTRLERLSSVVLGAVAGIMLGSLFVSVAVLVLIWR